MPKVYHVLSETEPFSMEFGGALSRWTANALRDDDQSIIVCPSYDDSFGFPKNRVLILEGQEKYLEFSKIFKSRVVIDLRLMFLRRLFARFVERLDKGDIVYIHNRPDFGIAMSSVCRKTGNKVALHMHNSHLLSVPVPYRRRLSVQALAFCSDFLRSESAPLFPDVPVAEVIPNGADEHCFFPSPHGSLNGTHKPVILFVGRLVHDKGVHVLIEAMRKLEQRGVQANARIIGSVDFGYRSPSNYLSQLKQNTPSNVAFGDYITGEALAQEYRNATIFCAPSVWNEPFGMVNVEAMATKLPVVTTNVGGIPEIFRDGGGILVESGSVDQLAAALELLIKNPAKRRELGDAGYRAFQHRYRWPEIHRRYCQFIETLQQAA
jgi:spore coat protein SA